MMRIKENKYRFWIGSIENMPKKGAGPRFERLCLLTALRHDQPARASCHPQTSASCHYMTLTMIDVEK